MPPFAATGPWSRANDSVLNEDEETSLQEAQLADWLVQGGAFSAKSPEVCATEEAVILKVFSTETISALRCSLLRSHCTAG